ncbi:MAG: translation initiation factor IF-3, partial [Thermodesulfovibrionia bacterium]|nr:translation initiation factor IF-3 [Thermodesulfovibrionia bacterium]
SAEEEGLDLVEVSPNARPPVCKILDYGKYRYQMTKKQTSKQKSVSLKEIKVRPRINKHDLDFKVKNIKKFLESGNKVKVSMLFRGREIVYSSMAKGVFDRVYEEISGIAHIERTAKLEGRQMTMILSPK